MSSNPQKTQNKMCKSPGKSANFQKVEKLHVMNEYETLSTNCTVVGSNNLHLVKKPQMVAGMSPGAYSNPSPVYPASPYSSPASLKSPSPQSLRPPTPQPTTFQQLPVMQIIHNSHHQILARPLQTTTSQPVIKLKPHLNILPKPAASPQPPPKPSVSPQIVIPTNHQTIMPTAQPLLLNQMPMLTQGVQFILRPQTTKMPTQMPTATPQGLILQPSGQQLLQLQTPRSQPQMMRVLTNGMQLAPPTTTYVTHLASPASVQPTTMSLNTNANVVAAKKSKPKKSKPKSKLDLANIMKLSGIGDDDDVQFESDTSESASEPQPPPTPEPPKRLGNIQISAVTPTINATAQPTNLVQVLSQNFQNSMTAMPNSGFQTFPVTSQSAGTPTTLPFNPFIAPNFAINNGLMVQRNGGFKLTLGEDGRLVLQHDPTLNQDLQSQLLLQSIFGLPLTANGGLVLQPSVEHQQVQTQTIQHVQQQQVQTQTVQHVQQQQVQTQTVQHVQQQHVQTIHSQPMQASQASQTMHNQPPHSHSQPIQAVQPQPIVHTVHPQVQTIQSQTIQSQSIQSQTIHSQPIQAVHPQPVQKPLQPIQKAPPVQAVHPIQSVQPTIAENHSNQHQHQHHHHQQQQQPQQQPPPTSYVVNLTPDQLEQLKRNGQLTVNGQTIFMQRPNIKSSENTNNAVDQKKLSPKSPVRPITRVPPASPTVKKIVSAKPMVTAVKTTVPDIKPAISVQQKNNVTKSSLVTALQAPPKHVLPLQQVPNVNHVQPTPIQPAAHPQQQPVQPAPVKAAPEINGTPQEVERLLGQILEDATPSPTQRVHTIQLTPQKQQLLRSVQLQIQTLSARLTPGDAEMQTALKLLFAEQSKILASGKLLSPDKVYYHNNQIIAINPSVSLPPPVTQNQQKAEPPPLVQPTVRKVETSIAHQVVPPMQQTTTPTSRVGVSTTPTSEAPQVTQAPQVQLLADTIPHASVPPVTATVQPMPPVTPRVAPRPTFSKSQLMEQQLTTDQNGAVKPDTNTPFSSKADACKRLIRYHCYNQPVLSQKDLDKADEIFELTARHFIDKFSRMVDKYRYLLHKESMRQVQTSELMMIDRMFLSEEQQSLMRLRQEQQEAAAAAASLQMPSPLNAAEAANAPAATASTSDDYDEWACIQRELGCLQEDVATPSGTGNASTAHNSTHNGPPPLQPTSAHNSSTGTSFQQSTQQQLFNQQQHFQQQQHVHTASTPVATSTESGQSTNQQPPQQSQQGVVHATSSNQLVPSHHYHHHSQQHNFNQHIHSQQIPQHTNKFQPSVVTSAQHIQQQQQQMQQQSVHAHHHQHTVHHHQNPQTTQTQQQMQPPKRSASSDSRLETLKRFRVDKHNKKPTEDATQAAVHHLQTSSMQQQQKMLSSGTHPHSHHHHHHHHHPNQQQQQLQQQQSSSNMEPLDNSIDEQVQSAIDSILNLQQSSGVLDLDEAVSSILS